MITKISMPIGSKKILSMPSFGFARLNDLGRTTADSFGYQNNEFLNADMFRRQGWFHKSQLTKDLSTGVDFVDICTEYGCTNNAKTNAEFIENQILSSKSEAAIRRIDPDKQRDGFIKLYMHNYDNPELSLKSTKLLLDKIKDSMSPEEYIKHTGILQAGTQK